MNTTRMFENFIYQSNDYIPNNTVLTKYSEGIKDIVRGTTPEHFLVLPVNFFKDVKKLTVTYKQGLNIVVKKNLNTISVDPKYPHVIYYEFTEEETKKFKAIPNCPIEIQVKVLLQNNDVLASDVYFIHCLEILDKENIQDITRIRPGDMKLINIENGETVDVIPYNEDGDIEVVDINTGWKWHYNK